MRSICENSCNYNNSKTVWGAVVMASSGRGKDRRSHPPPPAARDTLPRAEGTPKAGGVRCISPVPPLRSPPVSSDGGGRCPYSKSLSRLLLALTLDSHIVPIVQARDPPRCSER
ncbi:hypothetical protein K431DRAFT_76991 [Polychaeton citri CBS 116435]|uniref:Uncharacterized protein n=1 Tax=Polychaeton citri CBS 116435 TaxID=1314669 RepID=A0A9P4Q7S9_9PEZI|nr:hypothetical protein K431DRAFT_76991 [Polychaeton citri CBS 116435]